MIIKCFKHNVYFTLYYESVNVIYTCIRKHSTNNNASVLINYNVYFTSCYESARVKYINIRKHNINNNASALIKHNVYFI